jgi:hypothetical protein
LSSGDKVAFVRVDQVTTPKGTTIRQNANLDEEKAEEFTNEAGRLVDLMVKDLA